MLKNIKKKDKNSEKLFKDLFIMIILQDKLKKLLAT
jgi:hypothetical protein